MKARDAIEALKALNPNAEVHYSQACDAEPNVSFVYLYGEHPKAVGKEGDPAPKPPISTFCVIAVDSGGDLDIGVGASHCSPQDCPNRKTGRKIARARAMGALESQSLIHAKNDQFSDCDPDVIGAVFVPGTITNESFNDFGVLPEQTVTRLLAVIAHFQRVHESPRDGTPGIPTLLAQLV